MQVRYQAAPHPDWEKEIAVFTRQVKPFLAPNKKAFRETEGFSLSLEIPS